MDYFEKLEKNPYEDLKWNIPERKQGTVNVIGGNSNHFRTEVNMAEFLGANYPVEKVNVVLPDSLKRKLPPLDNFVFLPSTDSGSLAESQEIIDAFNTADFNLVIGDLSKNKVTGKALASACRGVEKMTLITRDSVDALAENEPEKLLMNENLIIMASIPQLVKLLHAVYYPKMLLQSQSLVQVSDVLHKFTLSYPVRLVTLHNEQVLIVENGNVKALPLSSTGYSPMTFWFGEPAAKIVTMNLFNPNSFIKASVSALF